MRNFQDELIASPSFASTPDLSSSSNVSKKKSMFQLVKRTGASLRNSLVKHKSMALNKGKSKTVPCKQKNCQCCRLISNENKVNINGIVAKSSHGNCTTYNVEYCFVCLKCTKGYVGRTVQRLNERAGQHRRNFYDMLKQPRENFFN